MMEIDLLVKRNVELSGSCQISYITTMREEILLTYDLGTKAEDVVVSFGHYCRAISEGYEDANE